MNLLLHTNTMAAIRSMRVTETTAAIMPIISLKWKKKITSNAEFKKISWRFTSTSESLKIMLQISRYVFKLLEKNVLKLHYIHVQFHVFVIICEHMVLRRVWFIRCWLFCWCSGCCSNSICSACCCCCWVCCFAQGNELITVCVCKLSIKKEVDLFDFLN